LKNEKTFKALIQIEAKDNASKAIEKFNARFSNLKTLDSHFNFTNKKLFSTAKLLDKYSEKIENFGGALTKGISAPIVAGAAYGIKVAGDFEREMLKAKAATDGAMFGELRSLALSEASRTQFSPSETAQGIRWLGQGGMKSPDVIKSLPATLDLASAGDTDLAYTADILGGMQSLFGRSADQIRETVDKLTVAFSDSALSLPDVVEALKYGGFTAKASGQDMDSTLFGVSALSDLIKGSSAGTGISNIFEELTKLEPRAKKAFEEYKIHPKDIYTDPKNRVTRPLLEIIKLLKKKDVKYKGLLEMFQVQGSLAMLAMMDKPIHILEEKFQKIKTGHVGQADKFAKANTDGALNQLKILGSNLAVLQTKLWDDTGILKDISDFFKGASEYLSGLNKSLTPETAKFYIKAAGLITIIGPLIAGIGMFITFGTRLTQLFFGLDGAMAVLTFIGKRFLWVGVFTAIVTAMTLIWDNWSTIKNKLNEFNDWLKKTWFGSALDKLGKLKIETRKVGPETFDPLKRLWTTPQAEKKQIEVTFKNLPESAVVKEKGFLKGLNLNLGYATGVGL
jgi:TP901 family phage tail tape measure protein